MAQRPAAFCICLPPPPPSAFPFPYPAEQKHTHARRFPSAGDQPRRLPPPRPRSLLLHLVASPAPSAISPGGGRGFLFSATRRRQRPPSRVRPTAGGRGRRLDDERRVRRRRRAVLGPRRVPGPLREGARWARASPARPGPSPASTPLNMVYLHKSPFHHRGNTNISPSTTLSRSWVRPPQIRGLPCIILPPPRQSPRSAADAHMAAPSGSGEAAPASSTYYDVYGPDVCSLSQSFCSSFNRFPF